MPAFLALLALFAFLACAAPKTAVTTLTAAHKAAMVDSVEAMLDSFRLAIGSLSPERIASFYASDSTVRWIEDGEVRLISRGGVIDQIKGLLPVVKTMSITYSDIQVTPLAPGAASFTTDFVQKITDPRGETSGLAGVVSAVVVHGESGWKFVVGHTSSRSGPTTPTGSRRG